MLLVAAAAPLVPAAGARLPSSQWPERAPACLAVQVMDSDAEGSESDAFRYFKRLCIHGFLACRKHAERIIVLIEMMQVTPPPSPACRWCLPRACLSAPAGWRLLGKTGRPSSRSSC